MSETLQINADDSAQLAADNGSAVTLFQFLGVVCGWQGLQVQFNMPVAVSEQFSWIELYAPTLDMKVAARTLEKARAQLLSQLKEVLELELHNSETEQRIVELVHERGEVLYPDQVIPITVPMHAVAYVRLASFYLASSQFELAFVTYQVAKHFGESLDEFERQATVLLALAGHVRTALKQEAEQRARRQIVWPGTPESAAVGSIDAKALDFAIVLKTCEELAGAVVQRFGALDTAAKIYQERARIQAAAQTELDCVDDQDLVLPEEWTALLGHINWLNYVVKLMKMDLVPWKRVRVLAPPKGIANHCYLNYWSKYVEIVSDPEEIERLRPIAQIKGFSMPTTISIPGYDPMFFSYAKGIVNKEWALRKRGSLLELEQAHLSSGRQVLRDLGLPADAWYVGVHCRESGFHGDTKRCGDHSSRNQSIKELYETFQLIADLGGWVIRMGDRSMSPMAALPNVIDYASSWAKSEWMDVFLVGSCRIFLGGGSGLAYPPETFERPLACANWVGNEPPTYHPNRITILKLIWHEAQQRFLTFREMYSEKWRGCMVNQDVMSRYGLRPVENSSAEIRALFTEIFETVEGKVEYSPLDHELQDQFHAMLTECGFAPGICSRIGRDFLRRHQELLK